MGADTLSTLLTQDTTVETMFYGIPVSLDGQHVILTIHNLKEQDFTGYTLIITNGFGTIEKQMTLNGESELKTKHIRILNNETFLSPCNMVCSIFVVHMYAQNYTDVLSRTHDKSHKTNTILSITTHFSIRNTIVTQEHTVEFDILLTLTFPLSCFFE